MLGYKSLLGHSTKQLTGALSQEESCFLHSVDHVNNFFGYSLNMFIVDDDDDDDYNDIIEAQDDDVFCDPGFTPEPGEFLDDDKENEDCIELATPGNSTCFGKN